MIDQGASETILNDSDVERYYNMNDQVNLKIYEGMQVGFNVDL